MLQLCGCHGVSPLTLIVVERCGTFHHYYPIGVYTPGDLTVTLELSNNRVERSIKPFVMGRKGWLFSNTPAGAQASAVIYSLIETAKENDLDPYRYLLWVLESAPAMALEGDAWAGMLTPANAPETCKIPKETQPDETNEH